MTGKLNPSLTNAPWTKKKDALFRHSVLRINNDLLQHARNAWDETAIRERGERITETILDIWPGPSSAAWQDPIELDAPLGTPGPAPELGDGNSEVAAARSLIETLCGPGSTQVVGEALLDEILSWPGTYVRVQRRKDLDKSPRRILFIRKPSSLGAFVHMYPKRDHISLIFRLQKHFAEGKPLAEARDVRSTDPYQVRIKVPTLEQIPDALELAQPAYDELGLEND
ncbi:MAG: GmrSD restriction endonuclease domain-containing protein [Actinomycetota bacterium]